ncbi:MAG: peptidylprolyl isomerase [Waterburya sp.]
MTLVIQSGEQTLSSQEIIPLLARYQMLPQLISQRLIDQAIATIECTDEEKTIACQQFYQQYHLTTEAERQTWATSHCLTQEDIETIATRQLKIEKFKLATWQDQLPTHFLRRKKELDQAIYSLIRTKDIGIAQEIYFRLEEKEQSFAELAQQYSQGLEAKTGGLLGPVEFGHLPLPLAQKLRLSQCGQISRPFPLGEWIVIVRLDKFISAELNPMMCQRLLNEKFRTWLQKQLQEQGYQISNFSFA